MPRSPRGPSGTLDLDGGADPPGRHRVLGGLRRAAVDRAARLIAYVFRVIWPPLILAGAIVFLLNPVVTRLQARHIPRALGTALSYLAVVASGARRPARRAAGHRQSDELAEEWPELRSDLEEESTTSPSAPRRTTGRSGSRPGRSSRTSSPRTDAADTNGDGVVSEEEEQDRSPTRSRRRASWPLRVFHVGIIFVLGPIIAFYLLVDLPHIRRVSGRWCPSGPAATRWSSPAG